jgi:hypothetical protein
VYAFERSVRARKRERKKERRKEGKKERDEEEEKMMLIWIPGCCHNHDN